MSKPDPYCIMCRGEGEYIEWGGVGGSSMVRCGCKAPAGTIPDMESCPFCGEGLTHVRTVARSFDPPRLYHELHHARNGCALFNGRVWSFTEDPKPMEAFIAAWNTRAP